MDKNTRRPSPLSRVPKVGLRTIKTVLSATLVALVYGITGRNPCFACIGAVFGLGSVVREGLKNGGNRFIGTLIGGLIVMPVYWCSHLSGWPIPEWLWIAMGLFLVLYVSQIFGAHGGIQPGAVVFFVVMETVIPERFVTYTIARIIDTGIGMLFSLAINVLFPSPLEEDAEERHQALLKMEEAVEEAVEEVLEPHPEEIA